MRNPLELIFGAAYAINPRPVRAMELVGAGPIVVTGATVIEAQVEKPKKKRKCSTRKWTPEQRAAQAEKMRALKPWLKVKRGD